MLTAGPATTRWLPWMESLACLAAGSDIDDGRGAIAARDSGGSRGTELYKPAGNPHAGVDRVNRKKVMASFWTTSPSEPGEAYREPGRPQGVLRPCRQGTLLVVLERHGRRVQRAQRWAAYSTYMRVL